MTYCNFVTAITTAQKVNYWLQKRKLTHQILQFKLNEHYKQPKPSETPRLFSPFKVLGKSTEKPGCLLKGKN